MFSDEKTRPSEGGETAKLRRGGVTSRLADLFDTYDMFYIS
jgi:hypothetical protein